MAGLGTTGTGHTVGAGPVTLVRHGGGAGPDWGAYVLLVTTMRLPDGGTEAVIAATAPDQVHPGFGLHLPRPYGPTGSARKPLWEYAAAATATTSRFTIVATSTISKPWRKVRSFKSILGNSAGIWPAFWSFLWRRNTPMGMRTSPAINKPGRSRKKRMPR